MKRVLVTGAKGFLGRQSLGPLLARGYEVHGVTRQGTPDDTDVRWHHADLLDLNATRRLIRDVAPHALLHFAWEAVPGRFWWSGDNALWLAATLELARAFAAEGGERFVGVGTCAEYDWRFGVCREDLTPLAPSTLYGATKHAAALVLERQAPALGLKFAWGRVFSPYGPGEHEARLVAGAIRSLLAERPFDCSHGRQTRDLMHAADVAGALVSLLDSHVTGAVNVASGEPVQLRAVLSHIGARIGRPELIRFGARPEAAEDPPVLLADVRRLAEEVGFRPQYDLAAGLEHAISWWRTRHAGATRSCRPEKDDSR